MHSLWKNNVEKSLIHDRIDLAFLSTDTYPYWWKKILAVRKKKITWALIINLITLYKNHTELAIFNEMM